MRSMGRWHVVNSTLIEILNTDRILIKNGFAQITLTDGAVLKLSKDTSLRLSRLPRKNMMNRTNRARETRTHIHVGKMWFSTRPLIERKLVFVSPTMSTEPENSEGILNVYLGNTTNLNMISGQTTSKGMFTKTNPDAMNEDGTPAPSEPENKTPESNFPAPSDEQFLNSGLVQNIDDAVNAWSKARRLEAIYEKMKSAQVAIPSATTSEPRIQRATAQINAEIAGIQAYLAIGKAYITTVNEETSAVAWMGQAAGEEVLKSLENAKRSLLSAAQWSSEAVDLSETTKYTSGSEVLSDALRALVSITSRAAGSHAESTRAYSYASLAQLADHESLGELAKEQAALVTASAYEIEALRHKISPLVHTMSGDIEKAEAIMLASQAVAEVASVYHMNASAQADLAGMMVSMDPDGQARARELASNIKKLLGQAKVTVVDITSVTESGSLSILRDKLMSATKLSRQARELLAP